MRTSARFPNFLHSNIYTWDFSQIFATSFSRFCYRPTALDQVLINFVVFIIYLIRVFPAVYGTFYQTIGDMDNITSKLNSLRIISWLQGDDTPQMQIGFKLDRYMNSLYIALINVLMMFVLFLTESTISVILNALAIEFVYMFDKQVAKFSWYDDNYRYLRVCFFSVYSPVASFSFFFIPCFSGCFFFFHTKSDHCFFGAACTQASVLEIIICGELRLEFIRDDKVFCREYDVDPEMFEEFVGGPLSDIAQARRDQGNPEYCLTVKDRLWLECAKVAKKTGRQEVLFDVVIYTLGFFFVLPFACSRETH